jgi:hypothetical protein
MKISAARIRMAILGLTLVSIVGAWGVTTYQNRAFKADLQELAFERSLEAQHSGTKTATLTQVRREYVLIGAPIGTIEVFSKNVESDAPILGVEYIYKYNDGEWQFVESGGCSGPACQTRGASALRTASAA